MTSVIAPQTLSRNLLSFCTSYPKQDEVEKGGCLYRCYNMSQEPSTICKALTYAETNKKSMISSQKG